VVSRQRKAFALYVRLTGLGVTADAAAHYGDEEWRGAAQAAEVRVPSSITRRIIVEMLAASERERALCSWCGLGDPDGEPGPRKPMGHGGACAK
jgi:hypothetical protein